MTKRMRLIVGGLAVAAAAFVAVAALAATSGMPGMGPTSKVRRPAFHGYYDGHKDLFLNTDVSSKMQAKEMHINFSAALAKVPESATPEIYLFTGKTAGGQLPVFGSEPGETTYSPIWHEEIVTWKAGATPKLIVRDDQVDELEKKGRINVRETKTVLNCPIVKVGKGGSS
jgi:hypothetical protein